MKNDMKRKSFSILLFYMPAVPFRCVIIAWRSAAPQTGQERNAGA